MHRRMTFKIDAKRLQEARKIAAEEGTSLSGLVTNWMEQLVAPRKRVIARVQKSYDLGNHPPSREKVHQRSSHRSAK